MSVRGLLAVVCLIVVAGTAGVSAFRPRAGVALRRDGSHVDVLIGGRPFTTYYFDPTVAKPYFFPLRSAAGTVVTRGFRHLRAAFDLITPVGTIARETQTYDFSGDDRSRTIDCEFAIHASHGPVTMGDTKEGTFAIRVVKALDSPPGRMVNANGATGEKGIWGKRAEWVDYSGRVADEEVGIAVFGHPQNLRAPTYWHARAYGLLAANPFGVRQFTGERRQNGKYLIPAGEALVFRYRVFIHHGDARQAQVAEAYRQFAAQQ